MMDKEIYKIKNLKIKRAFSLLEISILMALIALLMTFIVKGIDVLKDARVSKAQILTKNAPMNHMDDLIIWYETTLADSFNKEELVDGGNISIWYNRAPNYYRINNATQSVVNNQPIYSQNIFNKIIPSLSFDGNDFMNFDGNNLINSDYTLFFVEQRVAGSSMAFIGGASSNANSNLIPGYRDSDTITLAQYGNDMNFDLASYSSPISRIHTFQMSDRGGKIYWLNGGDNPESQDVAQTAHLVDYQAPRIGNQQNNWNYIGNMAEIIIFNRAIDDGERQEIEKYLSQKYGINLD